MKAHEASDVKAASTFPCEMEHSRFIQRYLEKSISFEKYDKLYIRPANDNTWSVLSRRLRVCDVKQSEEKKTGCKGD